MLTKYIKLINRVKIIIYGFLLIFAMNIFRIWLIIFLAVKYGFFWSNIVHMLFWKFISGVYVAIVWIILIRKYKVKSLPVYNDLKKIYLDIK
jgi:exosortase/archaeosortase family protein